MIIYAVICRARDAAVLAQGSTEQLAVSGNVPQVTTLLMQHIRDHPEFLQEGERKTIVQRNDDGGGTDFFSSFIIESCAAAFGDDYLVDEHYFHLYQKDGVVYACLADDPNTRDQKVNFAFLDHIQAEFTKLYRANRIKTANAYAMDKNYSPNLRSAIHYHNVHHKELAQDQKVAQLLHQVEDFKLVMGRNINLMLENQESLSALVDKSEAMRADASIFKKKGKVLKETMRRKYYCYFAVCGIILLLMLFIAAVGLCGMGLQYCRASSSGGGGGGGDSNSNSDGGGGGDAAGGNN